MAETLETVHTHTHTHTHTPGNLINNVGVAPLSDPSYVVYKNDR